jgi:hypothetical protein
MHSDNHYYNTAILCPNDGLVYFCTFVTGKFIFFKYPTKRKYQNSNTARSEQNKYWKRIRKKQKVYVVEFKDGELLQICRASQSGKKIPSG